MALLFNIIAIWVFYNWAVTLRYNTWVPASYYNIPKWCVTLAWEAGIWFLLRKTYMWQRMLSLYFLPSQRMCFSLITLLPLGVHTYTCNKNFSVVDIFIGCSRKWPDVLNKKVSATTFLEEVIFQCKMPIVIILPVSLLNIPCPKESWLAF